MATLALVDEIIGIFKVDRYPLVSILLPMYNAEKYICSSIDSIINQTYLHWELLIIDDGSNDNSTQIIKDKYLNIHSRMKLISFTQNVGIVKALNKGISECHPKTKYIARMDSDDISLKNRIEMQIKFMINNPEIDVLGTGVHLFDDENGKIFKTINYKCMDTISIKWSCLFFCPMNHPTVMFRKHENIIIQYDNTYNHCEDYHLWFKLLFQQNCNFANLDGGYLKLRKNQSSNISKKYHSEQLNDSVKLVRDYVSKQISSNEEKKLLIEMEVFDCIRSPKKIQSVSMFNKCYALLQKWEKHILKDATDNISFIKSDCDSRMAELISLCMQSFMIDAIQMMQKWKLRKPNQKLIDMIF